MRLRFIVFLFILVVIRVVTYDNGYSNGDRVRVKSKVLSDPVRYETKTGIRVLDLYAYIEPFPEVYYGDSVVIEGVVENRILEGAVLVEKVESGGLFYKLRKRIVAFFQQSLPEPHASLVAGIVLGAKSSMSESFSKALRQSGTAHVIVASGMNVSFVAAFLLQACLVVVNRKKALLIALSGVWLYVVLSGFDPPLIRAAIMGSIAFSAQLVGRLTNTVYILFLSAGLMLMANPVWAIDLGFILSFLATLSLILFQSKIDRLILFVPSIVRQDLSTTLAAQIAVSPVLYKFFGNLNLLSPLANVLVLWTIPLIMIIGGIAALLSLLSGFLAYPVVLLLYPLTSWFIVVVNFFG